MVDVILEKYIDFAPFCTNVIGINTDGSNKRASIGPIE